jgi:hypothetical protein
MTQVYPKNNITVNRVKNNSKIGLAVLEALKRSILHWTDDVQRDAEIKMSYNILVAFLFLFPFFFFKLAPANMKNLPISRGGASCHFKGTSEIPF